MSGHNKWSKIKHKKAITDAKRSKIFSKHAHLIAVASKESGGDTNSPALRTAIDKAKADNMPADNIDRAVKRGSGGGVNLMEEVTYEAYGPGGCALIIEGLTDNRNRASAEIKHILSKSGLSLAASGSATWAFEKTSDGWVPKDTMELSEDDVAKLESLVETIEEDDDVQEVYTNVA